MFISIERIGSYLIFWITSKKDLQDVENALEFGVVEMFSLAYTALDARYKF
jgi:hypothetical protein